MRAAICTGLRCCPGSLPSLLAACAAALSAAFNMAEAALLTATIPRVKLPRAFKDLPPYRPGHWILAGTPAGQPYPCVCWYDNCNYPKCPDLGRTEGLALPPGCCGRASGSHGERTEPAARYASGNRGPSPTWRPKGSLPQSLTPAGSSRRACPRHSALRWPAFWSAPWDREPPAWDALDDPEPPEDGPDEASPFATEELGPVLGHADGDAALGQHSEPSDGLQQARNRIWADQCDCPTPWDPPPAALLVADTKTGPVRKSVALDGPRPESRERAEQALAALGWRLAKPWRDGRHTLLPPEGKLKTRPGLVADLVGADNSRAYGVVSLPPRSPRGQHRCHQIVLIMWPILHRPSWMRPCHGPSADHCPAWRHARARCRRGLGAHAGPSAALAVRCPGVRPWTCTSGPPAS
jgi:hypothetical protein